jgi:hypothetical protein
VIFSLVENQISGAGDSLPVRPEEKVSSVPSLLMTGRASNAGELNPSRWTAVPNGWDVLERVA